MVYFLQYSISFFGGKLGISHYADVFSIDDEEDSEQLINSKMTIFSLVKEWLQL